MTSQPSMPAHQAQACVEIAVVCEDEPTRLRAQRICDELSENLTPDFQCNTRWWRIDQLRDVIAHHEAAEAAAHADMLVVSVHSGDALPRAFDAWIDDWVTNRKPGPAALVGLVGTVEGDHQRVTPRHDLLRRVATRAGMDYLPEGIWERSPRHRLEPAQLNQRHDDLGPMLEEILNAPHPVIRDFGINE